MTKLLSLFVAVVMVLGTACGTSGMRLQTGSISEVADAAAAEPVATNPGKGEDPDPAMILQLLMGGMPEEKVSVQCPKTGNCVPTYRFDGGVTDSSASKLVKWMKAAEDAGAKALVIEIETPGGSLDAGYKIIRALEDSKVPSYCVGEIETMSAGFAILESCTHRMMTKRTQLLAHEPHVSMIRGGSAKDLQNSADYLRTTARAFAEHCAARLKISLKEYLAKTDGGKDWFMNWEEALQVGAVDRVVPSAKWVTKHLQNDLKLPR